MVSRLSAATSGSCTRGVLDSRYRLDTKESRFGAVLDRRLCGEATASGSCARSEPLGMTDVSRLLRLRLAIFGGTPILTFPTPGGRDLMSHRPLLLDIFGRLYGLYGSQRGFYAEVIFPSEPDVFWDIVLTDYESVFTG